MIKLPDINWYEGQFFIALASFLALYAYINADLRSKNLKFWHMASYPIFVWTIIAGFCAFISRTKK